LCLCENKANSNPIQTQWAGYWLFAYKSYNLQIPELINNIYQKEKNSGKCF
jgi:hypothetical protein